MRRGRSISRFQGLGPQVPGQQGHGQSRACCLQAAGEELPVSGGNSTREAICFCAPQEMGPNMFFGFFFSLRMVSRHGLLGSVCQPELSQHGVPFGEAPFTLSKKTSLFQKPPNFAFFVGPRDPHWDFFKRKPKGKRVWRLPQFDTYPIGGSGKHLPSRQTFLLGVSEIASALCGAKGALGTEKSERHLP